jgi:hypothetical protein
MPSLHSVALAALLIMSLRDVPTVHRFQPERSPSGEFPPGGTLPVVPDLAPAAEPPQSKDAQKPDSRPRPQSSQRPEQGRMDQKARIEILRSISGEFARAVRALPSGKNGLHIRAGKPPDEAAVNRSVVTSGAAANPGDQVQITLVEFRDRELVIDVNGGGRQHTRWRDRVHLEVGGIPTARAQKSGPPGLEKVGSTIYLEFDHSLPALTPDQVKQFLSAYLDFAKQRSAAVQWVDTLPPEMQEAIKNKQAVVGMTQDMVIAAVGRPDKKVRERDEDGLETEDWIYGHPPGRTTFVKFAGEKVISVKRFQ